MHEQGEKEMRKKILLRNEIEMLQIILREEGFPTKEYRLELAKKLEELKIKWYKVKELKKGLQKGKFVSTNRSVEESNL